jgi:hypothetical protein
LGFKKKVRKNFSAVPQNFRKSSATDFCSGGVPQEFRTANFPQNVPQNIFPKKCKK